MVELWGGSGISRLFLCRHGRLQSFDFGAKSGELGVFLWRLNVGQWGLLISWQLRVLLPNVLICAESGKSLFVFLLRVLGHILSPTDIRLWSSSDPLKMFSLGLQGFGVLTLIRTGTLKSL